MKYLIFFFMITTLSAHAHKVHKVPLVDFTVVGAGPAGITTIALLLSMGIPGNNIVWIDPEFSCGRLKKYVNTDANAKTKMLVEYMQSCQFFKQCPSSPALEHLLSLDPEKEYPLRTIYDPLIEVTRYIRSKIISYTTKVQALRFDEINNVWIVSTPLHTFISKGVVLATGSFPRSGNSYGVELIDMDDAVDPLKLATLIKPDDTIGVIGSAHSAILILKYLHDQQVQRIFNFYTHPIVYPTPMDGGWILNDNTGLMGVAARFAQEYLENDTPSVSIIRLKSSEESLAAWAPLCTKLIYAIGFQPNSLPFVPGIEISNYNPTTGVIAQHLFGIGIAFPEHITDPLGNVEKGIGLPDFMDYAQRIIPTWKELINKSPMHNSKLFSELFNLYAW